VSAGSAGSRDVGWIADSRAGSSSACAHPQRVGLGDQPLTSQHHLRMRLHRLCRVVLVGAPAVRSCSALLQCCCSRTRERVTLIL
jgi:hypothetical protein